MISVEPIEFVMMSSLRIGSRIRPQLWPFERYSSEMLYIKLEKITIII